MKKLLPFLLALLILITGGFVLQSFISQKKMPATTADENRTVASFDKISVAGSFDVFVKRGEQAIFIQAEAEIQEKIKTEVKNNELRIYWDKKGSWNWSDKYDNVKIYITVPSVNALSLAGSGDIQGESNFSADNFNVSVAGSGNIEFAIDAKNLETDIAGSGDVALAGKANFLAVSIAGSGNFAGDKFSAENAEVSIAGSGDVIVFVKNNLNAEIAGSGDITYTGDPQVKKSIAGSGDVVKK